MATTKARRKPAKKASAAKKTVTLEERTPPWKKLQKLDLPEGRIIPLTVPWEARSEAKYAGAKFVNGVGWFVHESKMTVALSRFTANERSWEALVADIAASGMPKAKPGTLDTGSFSLRDDQIADRNTVTGLWKAGGDEFGLFSSTGVGKTVTSIAAVNAMKGKLVVVFCPKSVMPSWTRTIAAMGDAGKKWVVINYESSKKLLKPTKPKAAKPATQNKNLSLYGVPWIEPDFVICDEAHKLKNPTSQQSRVVEKVISASDAKVLRVTATPAENPAQMHYMWRGLTFATGAKLEESSKGFEKFTMWAGKQGIKGLSKAPFGNGLVYDGGPEGIARMNEIVYGGDTKWALRRKPEGWPEQKRTGFPVWLSAEEKVAYEQEWQEFLALSVKLKTIIASDRVSKAIRNKAKAEGLAAYMRYRQKTGVLKTTYAADRAKELVSDDIQVVLACSFKIVAEALAERMSKAGIPFELLTGEVTGQAREDARLRFQRGEAKVVICSITTGISLHQNETGVDGASPNERRLVVVEMMQSGLEQYQLEGRVTRDGVMNVCEYLYATGTIDEKLYTALLSKMASMARLHKEEVVSFEELANDLGMPGDLMF